MASAPQLVDWVDGQLVEYTDMNEQVKAQLEQCLHQLASVVGSIAYLSAAREATALAPPSGKRVLQSAGAAPSWVQIDKDHIKADAVETAAIKAGAVGTTELSNSAVTSGKLANNAVSSGKIADNAVSTSKLANSAVSSGKLADSAVTSGKLSNSAVTSGKLADSAVSSDKLANSAVTSGKLADNAVTSGKIADSAVTSGKLSNSAVTSGKLANNAVSSGKIADSAVTSGKIADNAVSTSKLAHGTANTVFLNNSGGTPTTGKITSAYIANDAIGAAQLASNSLRSSWYLQYDPSNFRSGGLSGSWIRSGSVPSDITLSNSGNHISIDGGDFLNMLGFIVVMYVIGSGDVNQCFIPMGSTITSRIYWSTQSNRSVIVKGIHDSGRWRIKFEGGGTSSSGTSNRLRVYGAGIF